MSHENIAKDIRFIIAEQEINMSPENSVRFILEDEVEFIGGYNIPRFRRLCRWEDLNAEGVFSNKTRMPALYPLSEEFIEFFQEDIGWYKISRNISLTENFIEKYQDKVNWAMISQFQTLSEPFIEKFKHKVKWDKISIGQVNLSEDFIWEYRDKLSINNLFMFNKAISQTFKDRIAHLRWS